MSTLKPRWVQVPKRVRTTMLLMISNLVGKILTMIIWLMLARFVDHGNFSLVSYFRTTLSTISAGVNFGYTNYIIKAAQRGKLRDSVLIQTFFVYIIISIFIGLILTLVVQQFLGYPLGPVPLLCIFTSAMMISCAQIALAIQQSHDDFGPTIIFNFILPAVAFFSSLAMIFSGLYLYSIIFALVNAILLVMVTLHDQLWRLALRRFRGFRIHRSHFARGFWLTGPPFFINIGVIGTKWLIETNLMAEDTDLMAYFYLSIMVFNLNMTILFSAFQRLFVALMRAQAPRWGRLNIYGNFILMLVGAIIFMIVPKSVWGEILSGYDPDTLAYFFSQAFVLSLLFSFKQGYGRASIALGTTRIISLDNLITVSVLILGMTWGIHEPKQYFTTLIFAAAAVNLIYCAWATRHQGMNAIIDFIFIHMIIIFFWWVA